MNPYYDNEKLDLKLITFDEPHMSYEYNTLCFWATKDGRVYTASDSGCSCPTPFEGYSGEDIDSVLQKLERIGSLEQALKSFDSWNIGYDNRPHVSISERKSLEDFVNSNLK